GRQLNLLDYAPMAGLKLEGFDSSLTPGEMPSTTVLEPQARHSTLPLISVVVDPDDLYDRDSGLIANYDRRGRSGERPAYATYIRDGEIVWATGAGLRVHGGKSRTLPSKSFRLHFRKIYGQPDLAR